MEKGKREEGSIGTVTTVCVGTQCMRWFFLKQDEFHSRGWRKRKKEENSAAAIIIINNELVKKIKAS